MEEKHKLNDNSHESANDDSIVNISKSGSDFDISTANPYEYISNESDDKERSVDILIDDKVAESGDDCSVADLASTDGKAEEEEDRSVADVHLESRVPDGGWGWMVALGTFIINMTFLSISFCFGILFSGFLLENGASSTTIAWIYNLFLVVWHLTMLFTSPLGQEFGQRTVGFVGVFMAFLSLILSGFSPSVYFLYFSHSLLGGVSIGLSLGIAFLVLPPYFHKKSGQANTLLVAGAPMSQMVLAPFIRYLLEVYSLKGAALIHSAVFLNCLIAVSFFHPVQWHLKPLSGEKLKPQQDTLQELKPQEKLSLTASNQMRHRGLASKDSLPQNLSVQKPQRSLSGSVSSVMSMGSDVTGGKACLSDEIDVSTISKRPQGVKAVGKTLLRVVERTRSDLNMLRQMRCVIIAVTVMVTQTTYFNFIMMLPFVVQAADHSLQDAAHCIALMGITNLVTRLVVSPLSDCKRFSIRASIMLGYLLRALGIIGVAVASELWQFTTSGVLFGLGLGFSLTMFNLVIVQYMGMDNFRPAFGIICLVAALGYPTLGPLIGVIRDTTNSYLISMCVLAALELFSVAVWLLMPAAQARDARMELRFKKPYTDH